MNEFHNEMLEHHADALGEHFDHVLVIVCLKDSKNSMTGNHTTRGGFYAGLGMAHDFIDLNRARHIAWQHKELGRND